MIAAVLHRASDLRFEDVPEPEPGAGAVKLRVAHNGLCGSDLHMYFENGPALDRPQVLGHEFSGTVVATGDGVEDLPPGTRAAIRPSWGCHACARCATGVPMLCPDKLTLGTRGPGGGLSEYVVVPRECVVPLAAGVSLADAALVEPMAVAYNAVLRSGAQPGATALILGAGPIGIGVYLGLRAHGVTDVVISEPSAERRAAVAALGARTVLDPATTDVVDAMRQSTDGVGADVVIEAAGTPRSFATALDACAPRGRLALIALFERAPDLTPAHVMRREIDLVGSIGYNDEVFRHVYDLLAAGSYPTAGWVEHVPFDALPDALDQLRRGERMKLLVDLPA